MRLGAISAGLKVTTMRKTKENNYKHEVFESFVDIKSEIEEIIVTETEPEEEKQSDAIDYSDFEYDDFDLANIIGSPGYNDLEFEPVIDSDGYQEVYSKDIFEDYLEMSPLEKELADKLLSRSRFKFFNGNRLENHIKDSLLCAIVITNAGVCLPLTKLESEILVRKNKFETVFFF